MARTLRNQRFNKIMYISIGGIITAVILIIILSNAFGNKKNKSDDIQIGENNYQEKETEQANSPVGKNVKQVKSEENKDVKIQVSDDTVSKEELVKDLNEENNKSIETANDSSQSMQKENEKKESESQVQKNQSNQQQDNSNKQEGNVDEVNNQDNSNKQNDNSENSKNEESKDPIFIKPVEGEIIKPYGKEKLIYSNTLKEWTTHLGIDIKADKTTVVKSASDGVVKSIKNDPRYGLTVVIEHKNGFSSVYSNLLTAEFVVVGENVKSGQTLGTVGNSATFEILDDSHLHFEILKDGNSVDPEMYIK